MNRPLSLFSWEDGRYNGEGRRVLAFLNFEAMLVRSFAGGLVSGGWAAGGCCLGWGGMVMGDSLLKVWSRCWITWLLVSLEGCFDSYV